MLVFSNSRRGAATIRERRLFRSALPEVRRLFESGNYFVQHFRRCGDYSRAAINQERRLIERIRYVATWDVVKFFIYMYIYLIRAVHSRLCGAHSGSHQLFIMLCSTSRMEMTGVTSI